MLIDPETIPAISLHPIYGIVEYYGRICIREQWYSYDEQQDRLIRSPNARQQEDLFNATA